MVYSNTDQLPPKVELIFGYENYIELAPNSIKGCCKAKDFKKTMNKLKEMME